jgi:hypothetical protein
VPAALDGLLQGRAGAEAGDRGRGDLDPLLGLRVYALARSAVGYRELPEAGEADLAAALERALDNIQKGVDRLAGVSLREA